MLSSAAKGREVMRKERSQFPHGHLAFFILLPSSSTIHLEMTAGVSMVVHTNILLLCQNMHIMHKRSKGTRGCGTKRSPFPFGLHLWLWHWNNTKTHQLWKLYVPLKNVQRWDAKSMYVHLLDLYIYYNYWSILNTEFGKRILNMKGASGRSWKIELTHVFLNVFRPPLMYGFGCNALDF